MKVFAAFCLLLIGLSLSAQDTILSLPAVEINQFRINPSEAFKVRVLQTDSLEIHGANALSEILRSGTAIFVKGYGGSGIATMGMRGTSAFHTLLKWNGIDISSPTVGQADLSLFPGLVADKISIRYGLASIIDGAGGLGGSVILNNQLHWENRYLVQGGIAFGSFGRENYNLRAEAGNSKFQSSTRIYYGRAENDFPYRDIAQKSQPVKILEHAQNENYGLVQVLGWKPNEFNLLSAKIWHNRLWRELPPPQVAAADDATLMRDVNTAGALSWTHQKEKTQLLVLSGFSQMDNRFTDPAAGQNASTKGFSWQNEVRVVRNFKNEAIEVKAGIEQRADWIDATGYASELKQHSFGGFAAVNVHITRDLVVDALLREEYSGSQFSPVLGSLAAIWKPGSSSVKLSFARNYRSPSLNERFWSPGGNPDLKPETIRNLEIGYAYHKRTGKCKLELEITGYRNFIDNWVMWLPAGAYWSPQNIKKVINTGAEAEILWQRELGPWVATATVSYAWTNSLNAEFYGGDNSATGKQLIYVPQHKFTSGAQLSYHKFALAYDFLLHGKYFISSDNKAYMPAFSLSDLRFSYTFQKAASGKFDFSASVNNLFNEQYQLIPYRPEMGINFQIGLCFTLSK